MSALAKTSTANAQATQHRTSPFSTASPSTCSNRTKPANAESTENASRPVGTMTTYFNSSDIKMRLPWRVCILAGIRRQIRRIIAVSLQERVFAASNPRTRREPEPTYKAAGSPQNPNTRKCKRNASDVVFTTKGSRRVLVSKRTRHEAACGTLHHRSSDAGGGVSGGPHAQATAGGGSARMWQDGAGLRGSRGGQYGG